MSEKDILNYMNKALNSNSFQKSIELKEVFGISAKEIADHFGSYRSNVSTILNNGVKSNIYIKIESRPVFFLTATFLKEKFNFTPEKQVYTVEDFKSSFYGLTNIEDEPFAHLIGYDGSQETQVQQAQSAILYPPNGLHTLITGESGTGKTLFARTMYNYGRKIKKRQENEFPFVEFNCADYYHNPQLLLSQLFGHIRGAFTGATQETIGLVEKANDGILFLDEIHRLSPEGQELLFYLMDTGQYRKLGEANSSRKANILIIGATTEDPNDVLLNTFKRRIPLSIKLPAYRDRPLQERLQIIEQLFVKESIVTQRSYNIESKIIKALATFDFPANIGQLVSEIKILCARSFLENRNQKSYEIHVPYEFLTTNIKKYYEVNIVNDASLKKELSKCIFDLTISPSNPIQYQKDKILDENCYHKLVNEINVFSKQGLSKKELAEKMNEPVTAYYNDILDRMYFKGVNREEIYKIVDQEIVDFSVDVMKDIHEDLNVDITQQHILVLAFHLKFLMERIKDKTIAPGQKKFNSEDSLVDTIIDKIESKFSVLIPDDERNFFRILLKNMSEENLVSRPELYILAHGNTATSLADVCNRLLNTNYVKAIDAPLSQDIEKSYQQFLNDVKKTQPKNGIMILADMGSLLQFGKRISEETGIIAHTIPNVTTALALDLAHIMLNRNQHVDMIYNEYLVKNQKNDTSKSTDKKPAIISSCFSGKGTSIAFQSTVEKILQLHSLESIQVFAMSNNDIQNRTGTYLEIESDFDILAIIGNIHLNTNYPFFHIANIVSQEKEVEFIEFIKQKQARDHETYHQQNNKDNDVVRFLEKHVMYVNPLAAVKVATSFIDNICKHDICMKTDDSFITSLLIHLGFMIERIIVNKRILFEDRTSFIKKNENLFNIIRKEVAIIENAFEIEIHNDEICYILVTLESKK